MLIERNVKHSAKSIFECDRCKRRFEGSEYVFRYTITNIKSSKSIKSLHLCKHCTKVFLAFVEKGVVKKDGTSNS